MAGTRYYDPLTGRFINADSVISGTGESVQGYNQFAYCFNNPINMSDPTGNWPKFIDNALNTIKNTIKGVVKVIRTKVDNTIDDFSLVNHVNKGHVTTPTLMIDGGTLLGKVGFSITTTRKNKEPGIFHSYVDIGNDANKYGVGINLAGHTGAGVGVSSKLNAYVDAQINSWAHASVSLGIDGIGGVIGFDVSDTSYDFEIKGGWGLIAIFYAPTMINNGQAIPAPAN